MAEPPDTQQVDAPPPNAEATGVGAGTVPDVERVIALIRAHRYRYVDELEFHTGIDQVLRAAGIDTRREVVLAPSDRIDFLLPGGLGIEVKLAGAPGDVLRQLRRYATSPDVTGLLLVTTRIRHVRGLPTVLGDTPLHALLLRGGL